MVNTMETLMRDNSTRSRQWFGPLGNMPLVNGPLPKPMLTKICDAVWISLGHNKLIDWANGTVQPILTLDVCIISGNDVVI